MNRPILIFAIFLIALAGGMLHYRIHPPFVDVIPKQQMELHMDEHQHEHQQGAVVSGGKRFVFSHGLASIFSLIDIVLITALFCWRKTAVYAFLLKGMLAIFAVVLMGHFSIVELSKINPTVFDWIFQSTLPDILIALATFLVAKAVYNSYLSET